MTFGPLKYSGKKDELEKMVTFLTNEHKSNHIYIYDIVCIYIYICMYVCMYVCMDVCMYVCMYACMHVCMYVCNCMYIYVCVYIYICIYIYVCIYIYMYVYIYICRDSINSNRKTMWFHEQNRGFSQLKRGLGKLPILLSMVIHQ